MKRFKILIVLILGLILFSSAKSYALTNDYEAYPPFLQLSTYSNLMLVLDYSGSMSNFMHYNYDSNEDYHGFFKRDKVYSYDYSENYWYIDSGSSAHYCEWPIDFDDSYSGDCLNWAFMMRIDTLRWVFTGGVTDGQGDVFIAYGTTIKNTDTTTYNTETGANEGILQELSREDKRPRVGALIFGGTSVTKEWIYPSYNYNDLIDAINDTSPLGGTPTGEAMDEVRRYFSLESGVWNGFSTGDNDYQDPYKFDVNGTVMDVACAKNFTVLMTDGSWNGHAYGYSSSCNYNSILIHDPPDLGYEYSCAIDPAEPAYNMWKGGNADLASSLTGNQNVQTYSVAAFLSGIGVNAAKNVAIYGGFTDENDDDTPCNYSDTPVPEPSCSSNQSPPCGSFTTIENSCDEWDGNNDGYPDNFFEGNSPDEIKTAIEKVFQNILKDLSSGTSVAVLTDKRKEGSIMTQAVFYPDYQGVPWIGKLFGYWFLNFKDPQGNAVQNIREDTNQDFKLNICNNDGTPGGDEILHFSYNDISNELSISHNESDCSGYDNVTGGLPYTKLEDINSLFEASNKLDSDYNSDYNQRTIYIPDNTTTSNLSELDSITSSTLISNFGGDNASAYGCLGSFDNLTAFIYGTYINGCVDRTDDDGTKRILGDIIYSTPRIANYDNMSMIYVAANDGMLHAFRAGKTMKYQSSDYIAVQLQNSKYDNGTSEIGGEEWAFIPRNAQPYLRYRAQPDFRHLYINDLTPYIFDYGNKKILIGGMRMGGGVNCNNGNADCISPPSDTISGHSSFYALDITDPLNPEYLWEFTDEYLGFAYSGPAVIKRNGKLYVMFLSGMKDYDGEVAYEGSNAKVYVLTLNTSNLSIEETNSYSVGNIDSSLKNNGVYGNRLFTDGVDLDNDGYTDAVFFAFSYLQSGDWTSNLYVARTDDGFFPSLNSFDKVMSSLHGAVTASIVYMPCFNMDYVYFGTGRWFYKEDDSAGRNNKLYGVNISCLRSKNCNFSSSVNNADICGELQKNTQSKTAVAWEVGLNTLQIDNGTNYGKERVISDPGKMEWADTVLFTSMQPSTNPCAYGGRSRGWGLNCATGKSIWDTSCSGYIVDNSSVTCGYLQTSTTAINQLCAESFSEQSGTRDVSNAMGNSDSTGGDSSVNDVNAGQTEWYTGVTPETPPIIPPPYSGLKGDILLWIEK